MKLLKVRLTKKADTSSRKLMKACDITPGQILVQWEAIKDMLSKIGVDIKKTRPTAYWEDVLFKKKTTGFPREDIEKLRNEKLLKKQ